MGVTARDRFPGATFWPIESAKYGDLVCVDPDYPNLDNDTIWLFLGRAQPAGIVLLILQEGRAWSGMTTVIGADGFVVVDPR